MMKRTLHFLLEAYPNTLPIAEILRGKNAWAWVSMVLYLKTIETHAHTFLPLNNSAVGSVYI